MDGAAQHERAVRTEAEVEAYVASTCFKTGPPGRAGVELEWLVLDAADPARPVSPGRPAAALAAVPLPGQGLLTTEPGGQLELSTACAPSLAACLTAADADLAAVRAALAVEGLRLSGDGMDPLRPPRRVLESPRYATMQRFFDRTGPAGHTMMCSTASLQVCLETGRDPADQARRWHLLHALEPVLVAATANSPFAAGRPTGARSTRRLVWHAIDPSRTRPPRLDGDPAAAWAAYALEAQVMCVRRDRDGWDAPAGLTFRRWLRGSRHGLGRPTYDDLAYHLSTLFPPVRPRGWLEVRYLDAQPAGEWAAVAAIVAALLDDDRAADLAAEATAPVSAVDPAAAAWFGLSHPQLARAARRCVTAALEALPRLGVDPSLAAAAAGWAARHTDRGRCPADDRLDAYWRTGRVTLREETVAC